MIYTMTLNPAIDKTVVIPNFTAGGVNRITSIRTDMGGKGINVSKCLQQMGCMSTAVAFLGGDTGKWAAKELNRLGIQLLSVEVGQVTRTNLKIIDPELHRNTDINEPGPVIMPEELAVLLEKLDSSIIPEDILILSGSVPPGLEPAIYRDLITRFRQRGVSVYLDADGDSFRLGITAAPDLIKPNIEELSRLAGKNLNCETAILDTANTLLTQGIGEIVISLGSKGALFVKKDHCWRAKGLQVPVFSTVGAGDSMVAALAYGKTVGLSQEQRIKLSIAISAASVMRSGTQPPERETIEKLYHQVEIEEVK